MQREHDGNNMPLVTLMDKSNFETKLVTVHELSLLHNYIKDSEIITGVKYEIPRGAVERRNDLLMAIAENNNLDRFFYSLDKRSRERSLSAFGDLICGGVSSTEMNPFTYFESLLTDRDGLATHPGIHSDALHMIEGAELSEIERLHLG